MSTAVLYSGQTRTFARTFPNHFFHLLRKLPDPEFFVSVQDDEDKGAWDALVERFPGKVHLDFHQQPQIVEPPPDTPLVLKWPRSSPPQAVLRQLWALKRVWDFYNEETEQWHPMFVRIRPDIAFHRCAFGPGEILEIPGRIECRTPWWDRWGGINDRLALMGNYAAPAYFNTFSALDTKLAGCPLHPETLIHTHLELCGISISHTLATEFDIVRPDGTLIPPGVQTWEAIEYARTKP